MTMNPSCFCRASSAAQPARVTFTAIGAFSEGDALEYLDWQKEYERIAVREQVEVLALVGDIALQDGSDCPAKRPRHSRVIREARPLLLLSG